LDVTRFASADSNVNAVFFSTLPVQVLVHFLMILIEAKMLAYKKSEPRR
jgi:hypothetical protein